MGFRADSHLLKALLFERFLFAPTLFGLRTMINLAAAWGLAFSLIVFDLVGVFLW